MVAGGGAYADADAALVREGRPARASAKNAASGGAIVLAAACRPEITTGNIACISAAQVCLHLCSASMRASLQCKCARISAVQVCPHLCSTNLRKNTCVHDCLQFS